MIGDGALTIADLTAIWAAACDDGYTAPFLAAGDAVGAGGGLEAYTQGFAQYARVSTAIDATMQACYIMPWSGQTSPSAAGEQIATVTLSFTRTKRFELPLIIGAGSIFFEEQTNDWSPSGSLPVLTGRRYTLQQDLVFLPGESGPLTAVANAERAGAGYNNPLPTTIQVIDQPGTSFNNVGADITETQATNGPKDYFLQTANTVDTLIPEHVGQYVVITTGPSAGLITRIMSFAPPQPSAVPPLGSTGLLEVLVVVSSNTVTGTFLPGESVTVLNGITPVGTLIFLKSRVVGGVTQLGFRLFSVGGFVPGYTFLGSVSGATGTYNATVFLPAVITDSANLTAWAVLDWALDLGLTVTNPLSPAGGRVGMLDAIGFDRNLPRNVGESDAAYRQRVHQVADTITPNAVRRMLNRVLGNTNWCFRETGSALLPGFFADRDASDYNALLLTGNYASGPPNFVDPTATASFQERLELRDVNGLLKTRGFMGAIGSHALTFIPTDGAGSRDQPYVFAAGDQVISLFSGAKFTVTGVTPNTQYPLRRYRVDLDYLDFRAFFLVSLPAGGAGDFGISYDNSPNGFYDAAQLSNFYDGFAATSAMLYKRLWQALDGIRAGGVVVDFDIAMTPCS
jgi:hypothetical protein